ncbi:hypothetical protein J5J83_05885 [Azoarcus sp. L1K30]|uniref:hypothetical protein n=1 Tax=Azoarcus sp. L1K30 TaxID=2820277 RepID=UPI001B83A2C4|nr:hypothetical protein [Azoarcus sp. L1K30]MBR0565647.1 hypothetical protein [Azoarcus sp. L1K30]
MARQRYRKRDDGLLAIAVRSDCKVSAARSAGSRTNSIVKCKVQCKPVRVKELREFHSVAGTFVIVPNGHTGDARTFATECRIAPLGGRLFLTMLQRLLEITTGEWTTPTVPNFGVKMMAEVGMQGPIRGCPASFQARRT